MGTTKFTIKIFQEQDGSFYAEVLELPGCFTTGETIDNLKNNINEAIECYLEGMKKDVEQKAVSFDYWTQYA
ncbi:MAG: type II toxin-antitoxin system HicB family antitoxin [Candidatus Absconditabacteria bacterium]|nr:type II toxin-antitoxin system HicB family antitoxin [Candidatus Absconditabacteria bacterium]